MTEPQTLTIDSIVQQDNNADMYLVTFVGNSDGRYFTTDELTGLGIAIPPDPDPLTTFDPDYNYPVGTVLLYNGSGKLRVKLGDDEWIGGSGEAAPTPGRNARHYFEVKYVPDTLATLRSLGLTDANIRYAARVWGKDKNAGGFGTSDNAELVQAVGAAAKSVVDRLS